MTITIPPFWTLVRRPGTQLFAVVIADTIAYLASNAGSSSMTVMTYFLQMMLVYRVWRGANMIPWALLAFLSIYEGFCVYVVVSRGAAAGHQTWVAAHTVAVAVTALVLTSPHVRARMGRLRGPRLAASE